MKFSIIIPTFNRWDLLKNCIDSIISTVDLTFGEVIVISNGCTDNTPFLVQSTYKDKPVSVVYWPKPLGYPKAINMGISASTGDIVILLNNDTVFLANNWYDILVDPFKTTPTAGITGVIKRYQGGKPWILFFCAAIKREVINAVGHLDETFTPGCGEDIDYCMKALAKGYTIHQVPEQVLTHINGTNKMTGHFPIYHDGGVTVNKNPNQSIIYARNMKIVEDRYGKPTDGPSPS
jgi:GT2 family glycosyltransferase